MITEKINQLKKSTENAEVKSLCETAINTISSAIYNNVSEEAKYELERYALETLFEGLQKFSKDKIISEWLSTQKRRYYVKNIGIRKAINNLLEKEGEIDYTLSAVLEGFKDRIKNEVPEVLLYEEFISAMSGFNFLPAVNTELNAVASRVSQYKNDVDITKILETMKGTRSNYLIPLIEDVIDNYLNNKNEQNKSFLKETLVKFSFDPFIRDIINIVTLDATQLQLEYANSECHIEDRLFSPILYLGENEVLFNIKGTYYVKKGNNVNKLKKEEAYSINENFRSLCDIINLPSIEVTKKDIKVFIDKDSAIITENEIIVNDKVLNTTQLNEMEQGAVWAGTTDFFNIVNILKENFNQIAELDFVKRVCLLENQNHAADIFKLRDNIFITTFDPIHGKNTFYRNINPLQAEKVMMEHMRFDVSKTFKDILPNREKILNEIKNTKKDYTDYIYELQSKINKFSLDYASNETTDAVVQALKEELEQVKKDYKDYLNEVEKFTSVAENLNITVQDDQSGKSYTVVVPTGAMAAKGERGGEGSEGDEFGTEVGMSNLPSPNSTGGAASAVTFDDDQSELLSDEPSEETDKVDKGADEIEAYADKVDAESELEKPEDQTPGAEGGAEAGAAGGAGGLGGAEEVSLDQPTDQPEDELGLGTTGEEEATEIETPEEGSEEQPEEGSEEQPAEEEKPEESVGAPSKDVEKKNLNKDKNPGDLDEPKKVKKVYLKRPKK